MFPWMAQLPAGVNALAGRLTNHWHRLHARVQALRTWLAEAWAAGRAELNADLRAATAEARPWLEHLPVGTAAEALDDLNADLADLWRAAGSAWHVARGWVSAHWRTAEQQTAPARAAARRLGLRLLCRIRISLRYALARLETGLAAPALSTLRQRLGVWTPGLRAAGRRLQGWAETGQAQARAWQNAHWPAARRRWRALVRRPEFLHYLVVADGALAASVVLTLAVGGPWLVPVNTAPAAQARPLPLSAAGRLIVLTPTLVATATPWATATAAPTPTPLLTATPIPAVFAQWESWIPPEGGWNGLGECWGAVLAPQGTGQFQWPTLLHYLVGWDYRSWHPGLDLGGYIGDSVFAADGGVVVYAGWNVYGFGNLVILDHGNGWHTLYAHLSEIHVACGQGLSQGQVLGLAGSTGNSTGPHLHFEMRLNGVNVNPWDYLPAP